MLRRIGEVISRRGYSPGCPSARKRLGWFGLSQMVMVPVAARPTEASTARRDQRCQSYHVAIGQPLGAKLVLPRRWQQ